MNAPLRTPPVPVIQARDGVALADSRDVARYFRREHKSVLRSIREAKCTDFFRSRNFAPCIVNGLDGKPFTDHVMMTKSGFAFVVLAFTGDAAAAFREDYINAYDRMEAELRRMPAAPPFDVEDNATLRRLLLGRMDRIDVLEVRVHDLGQALAISKATVAVQSEIVEAYEEIVDAEGSLCITDAAKSLGVRPCDLREHMRKRDTKAGWIYGRGSAKEVAYGPRLLRNELVHKLISIPRSDGTIEAKNQVRVTPRGLFLLRAELVQAERDRRKAAGEFDL